MACGKAGREKGHATHLCLNCDRADKYNGVCADLCMCGGECLFEPAAAGDLIQMKEVKR